MSYRRIASLVLNAALLAGLSGARLTAQTTTATILGTVTDSSGGAIPDAKVQVTNSGTNVTQTTTTDAQGRYHVPDLPIGDYNVQTEKIGFEAAVHKGITLTVGGDTVIDFVLPVGQVTQTITVEGNVSQVETTSAAISNLVEPTQMRELPLNGRNFEQLILLAPGVNLNTGSGVSSSYGFGSTFSVSGSRTRGQWEILDDNDVMNFQQHGSGSGVLGTSLGIDAIAEFSILTNTYSAQYGGNGAVVNMVTKSGTNSLHGSAYEFIRNSALDARNFFDPGKIAPLRKNQFGGTLGGPIKKDKMFFFTNYEGIRQSIGSVYLFNLPDEQAHNGFVPAAGGAYTCANIPGLPYLSNGANNAQCIAAIPGGGANSPIAQLLKYFPPFTSYPNTGETVSGNGTASGFAGAFEPFQQPGSENYVVGRYDWAISSKDSIFGRYLYDAGSLFESVNTATVSPLAPQGWGTQDNTKNQFISVEEKHIWSNNLISSTRVGFSRVLLTSTNSISYGPLFQFEGPNAYGFPAPLDGAVTITSLMNANVPHTNLGGSADSKVIQNKYATGEDIFWSRGAHSLRFGASVMRVQSYKFNAPSGGTWIFANMTNFLTDVPTNYTGTCFVALSANCAGFSQQPPAPHEWLESDFGFYIQDDWKARNNVTLNIGLRYEPTTNPRDKFGTMAAALNLPLGSTFNPALPMPGCIAPTAIEVAAVATSCPPLTGGKTGYTPISQVFVLGNPSLHNLDPRIGIAWDPFKDHKTSVRAGFGIFHSLIDPFSYTAGFTNTPIGTNVTVTCPTGAGASGACGFPAAFTGAPNFSPSQDAGIDDTDKHTAYMEQYNLTVQREIFKNTIVSIGYIGSRGIHLLGAIDENPDLPAGVPGAVTVSPGFVIVPTPALQGRLTAGTTPVNANGQNTPIVDAATGQQIFSTLQCPTATSVSGCKVVQNNRVDPAVNFINLQQDAFWSRYNSLQVGFVRRLTNNLQSQVSYTYSSCVDNSSASGGGFEGDLVGQNPWDTNGDSGHCHYMVRHNFYANGLYYLPFKGNRLVAGWQLGGILVYRTGTPLDITTGWNSGLTDRSGAQALTGRPNVIADCNQILGTVAHWSNPACYYMPPIGEPGNVGRYSVFGPDSMTFDGSVVKNTQVSERFNVQFRAEFFNLFNRANFRNSGQNAVPIFAQASPLGASCATTPSTCSTTLATAGQMTLTNTTSRQIQFGLKVLF